MCWCGHNQVMIGDIAAVFYNSVYVLIQLDHIFDCCDANHKTNTQNDVQTTSRVMLTCRCII